MQGCVIEIPLFGENYEVSSAGIIGPAGKTPTYDICVILSKYLLLCPDEPPKQDEWVSFRDLKDSGPLINYFSNDVANSIAAYFKGKLDGLRKVSKALSGYPPDFDVRYDIAMQFDALPRIPSLSFLMMLMKNFRKNVLCCLKNELKDTWMWNVSPYLEGNFLGI